MARPAADTSSILEQAEWASVTGASFVERVIVADTLLAGLVAAAGTFLAGLVVVAGALLAGMVAAPAEGLACR